MDIVIGENWLFTIPLLDVNEDPLVVSTLEGLKVQVIQYSRVKAEYQLYPTPDPVDTEIRVNPDVTTSFDFELTQVLSAKLKHGELFLKIFMADSDVDFVTDGEWLDIDVVKICDMV